ncbi:MAG TPA: ATP-binding protein [Opitutus sp.]|nr:ATP-binding protein [Opitutus sp.]
MKPTPSQPHSARAPRPARKPSVKKGRKRRAPLTKQELRELREGRDTLNAIRDGKVDAVVVSGAGGDKIYTLASAEQPYRIYVERMQEGAVTVSSEAVILYSNLRFAEMLGLPLEKVIGADLRTHLAPTVWPALADVARGEQELAKLEDRLQRADGASLPVMFTASPLPLENQRVLCLVATDLTAQQQTAELRLAKDIADKANLAKDAFLAALSHELRTPLNPALIRAHALEQDPGLPAAFREDVSLIRRNIELEARLIDDLLDLTRIARGKLRLALAPLTLNAIVRGALEICESDIRARALRVQLDCRAQAERSTGDGIRLQQAVWNLITNAAKFTPRGGRICISTNNPRPDWIAIAVQDEGIGFPPGDGERLFEAFEQGGKDVTRQFGGLGLGLAITRSIVAAHGGTVRAESDGPNHGARFTIELPLRVEAVIPPAEPARPAPRAPTAAGTRVLLVEDHRDTRNVMEAILRSDHFDVFAAGTAAEALAMAAEKPFDILIADLGLPDQSGLDLMRQLGQRSRIRGIATSGYGMEEDVAKCRAAGFDHHLTKPVRIDQLRALLSQLCPPAPSA